MLKSKIVIKNSIYSVFSVKYLKDSMQKLDVYTIKMLNFIIYWTLI